MIAWKSSYSIAVNININLFEKYFAGNKNHYDETHTRLTDYFIVSKIYNIKLSGLRFTRELLFVIAII